ncbi:PREDICTED: general odorant-binding protein 71 isoform X1 [Trachymyrmex cornetzi]|uniref:general odorant-binding protein 71 isoform X1 n=2 Tax=Trachymyrmex cornetzi TaxID=471704 RepID=UPI00084F237B|nr:PREDICTED: general odorant-binding protein 71 isoform X1 [Trachymyrmex cornetzi]
MKMVTRIIFVVLCSLCLLLLESANSLKCRSSVQQVQHDQYQKVMQICKARSKTDNNHSNNDSSSEGDDSDDSLSVDLFGTRFFIMNGGNKFSNIQSWKDPNENRYTNGNRKSSHSSRSSNNRDFSYSNRAGRSSYDQTYDDFENYGKQQEQCITQCFFNELNMVDQRGYPEQVSIIQFMTRNTHNPELQDLIEEAVIECYHYLDSDVRQNACYFSENLLTCLIDKGKERCEDWDD